MNDGRMPTGGGREPVVGRSGRRPLLSRVGWLLGALALLAPAAAPAARAQDAASAVEGEVFAGGELEGYLRLLQLAGESPLHPWSLRGFSVGEVGRLAPRDSAHPWAGRYRWRTPGDAAFHLVAPRARLVYNSAFPFGGNDGPVWAGRGLTSAVQLGFSARYRVLSLTVAPVLFRAENAAFDLVPQQVVSAPPYADWRHPLAIDLPQRFGDEPYARLDPGQSTLRADLGPVALGVSTANQYWGPATEYPLVLGNNAPGFAHVFAGSARPWNLWIGKAHGRFVWGRLEQSDWATTPDTTVRFMTGFVGVFTPRGVPGLEIGASRFFHLPWPEDGINRAYVLKPLETLSKANLSGKQGEILSSVVANQIASVFGRWAFPGSGLEVYGEFASEDHRHNLRDFILEPDHDTAYMLGFQKLWGARSERFLVLRGELASGEASHLARGRRQEPFYMHASMRQGHTAQGQILGTPAVYGGSASTLGVDLYHPRGRWSLAWERMLRGGERGEFPVTGVSEQPDVVQSVRAETVLFRGRFDITAGLTGAYEFNRDFGGDDAFNLNAVLGVRAGL